MTGLSNPLLRWLIAGLLFPLAFLNGWLALKALHYFQPLVTIFVLTALFAFVLDYPVRWLQRQGLQRSTAVISIFLATLLVLTACGLTLLPLLLKQFSEMVKLLPTWIDSSEQKLQVLQDWAISQRLPLNLHQLVTQLTDRLPDELEVLADQTLSLAVDTIDSLSEVLLTVVLTFYLLLDGERLYTGLRRRLPAKISSRLHQALQQNFQNYLIGQLALACLVGVAMTTTFLILKVPFGLLFGIGIGVMTLIPFGDIVGFSLVSVLVGFHDIGLGARVLAAAIAVDQVIDQIIAPRLLGSFTGLRPLWVIVALLVGTKVGGLVGLLVAVPLAGVTKSLIEGWQGDTLDTLEGESALSAAQLHAQKAAESPLVSE